MKISKKLSKKGAVALSVLIAVLIVSALYFSIALIKPAGAASPVDPSLQFKDGEILRAKIGSNGAMSITGTLYQNKASISPNGDDFVIKSGTTNIALIEEATGNLYLKGSLHQYESSLDPSASGNFIIKNSVGTVVAYFDSSGNLYLKDQFTSPNPYCGDGNCDSGEVVAQCAVDCGYLCSYKCYWDYGGATSACLPPNQCTNVGSQCNLEDIAPCNAPSDGVICCCNKIGISCVF